jgi:hypothetical protein
MSPEERNEFITELVLQIKNVDSLTDDEQRWVRMAIESEAQSIALRKAIIEKTLAGLVWMGVVGIFWVFYEFFQNHILK